MARTVGPRPAPVRPRGWRRLVGERRGVVMIELAIAGPAFLITLLVLFQFAYLFFAQQLIQAATEVASRSVQTGNAQTVSIASGSITAPQAFLNKVLCPALVLLSCADVVVNIQSVPSDYFTLGAVTLPTSTTGGVTTVTSGSLKFCNGAPGQLMLVNVWYMAPVWLFGPMPRLGSLLPGTVSYNGRPTVPLAASAAIGDENFLVSGTETGAC